MYPTIHQQIAAAGVEEEFHTVDLATRRLTGQAGRLMEQLPAGSFSSELQRSVLEANSRPWVRLADLAEDIAALRQAATAAADRASIRTLREDQQRGTGKRPGRPGSSQAMSARHPRHRHNHLFRDGDLRNRRVRLSAGGGSSDRSCSRRFPPLGCS